MAQTLLQKSSDWSLPFCAYLLIYDINFGVLNNSNKHPIISILLIINLHWVKKNFSFSVFEEIYNNVGQLFEFLAIIQLCALSLLQKTVQIRDQFFLFVVRRGSVQLVARRLAVRQARVRFSSRHHREVFPSEHTCDEEMERGLSEWRWINVLYECDCECMYVIKNTKNKQKEWHPATTSLKKF